jgi:hypothetical protein
MVELTSDEVTSLQKVLYRERRRMADLERMAKRRGVWDTPRDEDEFHALDHDMRVLRGLLDRRSADI